MRAISQKRKVSPVTLPAMDSKDEVQTLDFQGVSPVPPELMGGASTRPEKVGKGT